MKRAAGLLIIVSVISVPLSPYDCRNPAYRQQHSSECVEEGSPFLLGGESNGDRGGGGGLLGTIRRVLGI